jgi:hypothetical protein
MRAALAAAKACLEAKIARLATFAALDPDSEPDENTIETDDMEYINAARGMLQLVSAALEL